MLSIVKSRRASLGRSSTLMKIRAEIERPILWSALKARCYDSTADAPTFTTRVFPKNVTYTKTIISNLPPGPPHFSTAFIPPHFPNHNSLYAGGKKLKGTVDFRKGDRARVIQQFTDNPRVPAHHRMLLSENFEMSIHSPNWTSPPYAVLSKAGYLKWLEGVVASCPNFGFGASPTDGIRDPDGSVLILIRPYGNHNGAPYHVISSKASSQCLKMLYFSTPPSALPLSL